MAQPRRKFQRFLGERRYKKMFIIAVEGIKTEPRYFAVFNNQDSVIWVKCLRGNHGGSPPQVLRLMKNYLQQQGIKPSDEAWLVADKDQWTDNQLKQLYDWSQRSANYGFALSNPQFEYWLLLHFEDGAGLSSKREMLDKLNRYLPSYDKGIDTPQFTRDRIEEAIRRARLRDDPPCVDWPRKPWATTVYKLVANILGI
ncbi:MAG: RloB family protein [Deltaproteobacteria bacterium]|nr:RloB family protein [Deltaproteobacteria bacterium]